MDGGFVLRPNFQDKFRSTMGKKILSEVCTQILSDKTYEKATMEDSSKIVAEVVREKLKELNLPRYKFIVEVIVAEARGQGMCVNSACMWDSDTDNVVNHLYTNTNLFCEAIIFAVFNY
uniref:Tctex1 domain-containing protein 2 n=1 Tax=Rhabditophanes sp. KR3021 TaxID=114890 RepID=A0AC35TWG4_9BILA